MNTAISIYKMIKSLTDILKDKTQNMTEDNLGVAFGFVLLVIVCILKTTYNIMIFIYISMALTIIAMLVFWLIYEIKERKNNKKTKGNINEK